MITMIMCAILGQVYIPAGYSPPQYNNNYYDIYANPTIPSQLQNAMFRNQMSALNNQRLSLSIQGGQLWRQRYRSYKDWQMERMQIDKYRPLEIAQFNRELKEAKAKMFPPRPSYGSAIIFNGKTYSNYDALRQDPVYQNFIRETNEDRERQWEQDKRDKELAIQASAIRKNPDDYYKKIYSEEK